MNDWVRNVSHVCPPMDMEKVVLHRIWSETIGRLDSFRRRVAEGRDVMAASEFARWVFFSGLIGLFKENAQDGFFRVDGALIQSKCEQLIESCNERFRSNDVSPHFDSAEFKSLHEKVDCIAGYLSKLVVGQEAGRSVCDTVATPATPLPFSLLTEGGFGESDEARRATSEVRNGGVL
jgi:hypothetical protein